MSDEAIQLQQVGEALVEQPARSQPSYLGRVLSKAWMRLTFASSSLQQGQRPGGLEAFDMLGGWQGSDGRRRNR